MSGYIGVNNKARKIKSMYMGINGLARKVNSGYIGVNGKARKWYSSEWYVPNDQYESKSLGTWRTISDVDNFFNAYNHDNHYNGLKLGNYVGIAVEKPSGPHGGTKTVIHDWEIAGFDMEYKRKALDGTTYDNGYGICMIPKTSIDTGVWNSKNTVDGYISSKVHTSTLSDLSSMLQGTLGSHLINRNMLLSSEADDGYGGTSQSLQSSAYTWTTAYAALMSACNHTGQAAKYKNKYDDGEANYKLPLFNYEKSSSAYYILRNFYGRINTTYIVFSTNIANISQANINAEYAIRPMIYLR